MKKIKYFIFIFVCIFVLGKSNIVKANWAGCSAILENNSPVDFDDEFVYVIGSDGLTWNSNIYGLHYIIEYDPSVIKPIDENAVGSYYGWENINYYIDDNSTYSTNKIIVDIKTNDINKFIVGNDPAFSTNSFFKLAYVKFRVTETFKKSTKLVLIGTGYSDSYNSASYKYVVNNMVEDDYWEETCIGDTITYVNLYKKASLLNIKIDDSIISGFNSSTYNYNIEINKSEVNISAESNNNSSNITGDLGKKLLNYGNNEFKIKVTSTTGDAKEYTLNVNRPDNRSSINTLKSLSLSEEEINFNSSTLVYNINVDYKVDSLKINSELSDSKSSYVKDFGNRTVDLDVGINEVLIKVKAENGDIKIYTLYITRNEKNDSCNIKELNIKGYNLDFKESTLNYKLSINPEDTKLDISVKLVDANSKYEIKGNENLEDGSTVIIKVIDKKDNEKEYYINIVKEINIKKNNVKIIIITAAFSIIAVLGIVFGIYFFISRKKIRRR